MIYQFAWSRDALNYLRDNVGLVDRLELAFADLRKSATGLPADGFVDEGIGDGRYLWTIHGHAILIRRGTDGEQPKLWIEAIKPLPSTSE